MRSIILAWKKKLTPQQKAEYKAEKREEMQSLFKKINDGVKAVFESDNTSGTVGFRKTDMERLRMTYLIFILLEFLVYYFAIQAQEQDFSYRRKRSKDCQGYF